MRHRRVATAVVAALLATTCLGAADAGAAGDGGASTRVVGRGDIITSILGWSTGRRPGGRGTIPRCAWLTLSDAQLEWLVAVSAFGVALGFESTLLDPLQPFLEAPELPEGDLQGYVCGGATYELRFVPSAGPRSALQILYRQMITRLPPPAPRTSPPADAVVPVGQPVFFSIAPQDWRPVESTLTYDGTTAQVRAHPVSLRIITGDPTSGPLTCAGPGVPFRADDPRPASRQARDAAACTVTYRTASAGHRSVRDGADDLHRPTAWLGTVTVMWAAQWRVGTGGWTDLGLIPRTRLIARTTRDLTTSVQTPR